MNRFKRVILVDDNDADNVFHEVVIQRAGFDGLFLAFEDPVQALRELTNGPLIEPTLVLLDINMPVMDGFAFARELGPVKLRQELLTVVMLTSSNSEEDRASARGIATVDGYVVKPLLVERAQQLLQGRIEPL